MAATTLTTASGKLIDIEAETAASIKALVSRKATGLIPLDKAEALLSSLDNASGNIGDSFAVAFKGRKTAIRFEVADAGLSFATVPVAQPAKPKGATVKELRARCKAEELVGYSKLRKAELQTYLETRKRPVVKPNPGTVDWLRAQCRLHGIKGYSGLKKAALIALLRDNHVRIAA
ncbi:MAG: hypothetical protein U0793_03450 [Gemmataceae bacterium]